jgi:glyoxylase-like metal-dependent hydrolase (beta-lactamase superfamily II)
VCGHNAARSSLCARHGLRGRVSGVVFAPMGLVVEALPQLGITRVSRWIFNCYIIASGDGGAVVVDAGLPGVADDVAPVLHRLPGGVHAVVATHGHSDHIGGAAKLAKRRQASRKVPAKHPRCIT